ncbi:MAG: T9SS type A sorting domain-containing protein [Flavobacterium sp.]|nr:MAG: T9SS type A sorting domain-containing protein [Flavobacterium sp.]
MKKITFGLLIGLGFLAVSNSYASNIDPTKPLKKATATFATANDNCATAMEITTFPFNYFQADGVDAANDGISTTCLNAMNDGLWFTVAGNGNNIVIMVTPEDEEYDLQLGIFNGNCEELTCVGIKDDGYEGQAETYVIGNSEIGTTYYINVGHYNPIIDEAEGNFTIDVNSVPAPVNDNCAGAIEITSFPYNNEQTDGINASSDGFVTACENWEMNDGLWYTFIGDGSNIEVTVNTGEEYDISLGIFKGSCDGLECVETVDDTVSGDETILISNSEVGTVYYVNVGHYDSFDDTPEGNFTISVISSEAQPIPANDACETATAISSFPFNDAFDASATTNNGGIVEVCDFGMNDGIWYTVEGNGSDIIINATSLGWDAELAVYTGSCGAFECYDSVDDGVEDDMETITIQASEIGTIYYINFGSYDSFDDVPEGPVVIEVLSEDLSIGDNEFTNFKAYPNPVKDFLTLSHTENISSVEVYNLLGQKMLVKTINATQGQLNLSELSSGTYLVKAASGTEIKTIKVLKQ